MVNVLKMGKPSQKYVGFYVPFLGRVFAFKYDRSGKLYGFFVKYSPLVSSVSYTGCCIVTCPTFCQNIMFHPQKDFMAMAPSL
jgi:hypothetical protein